MREAASGKYVVYFDADMILTPGLIEQCVEQMEGKEIVALYVPEIILGKSLFSRVRRFERQFYDATPIDAVRFIRKDTFVDSGGFDEILFASGSGEDWDLDKKIRLLGTVELLTSKTWEFKSHTWIIAIAAKHGVILKKDWQGVLHNESTVKMINYLKKKRYYSTGFSGYISKWGKNDPDIRKQFGFFYRSLGVFIEYRKWKLLIRNPILYMLTIILKLTVVIATYRNWRIKK
jgi:glycosyltransferase involved in cell wall biosynthesis